MSIFNPADRILWGAATSAFQIEGAAHDDGKGPSIWDVYCSIPGRTVDGVTGEVACDHYHRSREDIALMHRLNLRAYRFSVSWPRVIPAGRGKVNDRGLDFYDRLVDALCAVQIEPLVTLYHWDLPAALQFELGGWASPEMPQIFGDYAERVFRRLGDRVRLWMTINEPWVVIDAGYFHGVHAPGIKDRRLGYYAGHNLIRAHAHAVARFRATQPATSQISFAVNTTYSFPATESMEDRAAAERAMLNFAGWFADPMHFGDYPPVMRERLGPLLPEFTPEETRLLRGSLDYLGLNYYFSDVVRHAPGEGPMELKLVPQPHLPKTTMDWPIMPDGLHGLLHWLHRRYGLPIHITENGAAYPDAPGVDGKINDVLRIDYLRDHVRAALRARREGVPVSGYFVWSLMDNLEWTAGFAKRFGLVHCDFDTLVRTIKQSGNWYSRQIAEGMTECLDETAAGACAGAAPS